MSDKKLAIFFGITSLILLIITGVLVANGIINKDYDCQNFKYQEDAQAKFLEHKTDVYHLDGDRDGVACEKLPHKI